MWWAQPPIAVLVLLGAVAVGLALAAPLHVLLLCDLLLSLFPARWEVGGILLDPTDVILAALAVGAIFRARRAPGESRPRVPYFGLWLLLGVLTSVSYLHAPDSQQYLTDPLRIGYQLYRYCWKGLLYYPLAVLLFNRPERSRKLILTVIAVGVLFSIQAIPGGYIGERGGPILSSNALGLALHAPLLAGLTVLMSAKSRNARLLTILSLLLIVRAITFSGSRGAFVADLAGAGALFGLLATLPVMRPRLVRLVVAAILVAAGIFVIKPDVLERPAISRMLTAAEGTEAATFEWRREERWPHFWARAVEHPWLGVGTDVDPALGASANTPHNGYLSLAVANGFPALAIVMLFAFLGLRDGVRLFRRAEHPFDRLIGAVCAASLLVLLVHNIVDNGFGLPFTEKIFWAFIGLAIAGSRRGLAAEGSVVTPIEAGFLPQTSEAGAAGHR